MSFPKTLMITAFVLFGVIGVAALVKKKGAKSSQEMILQATEQLAEPKEEQRPLLADEDLPDADRIGRLFSTSPDRQLPIVETITYTSRAPWIQGRPAWIADYASHYDTSTHFISRSLSRKKQYDYFKVANGNRFNVLKKDKDFSFYLLVDLTRTRCWFYYVDNAKDERVLLKVYDVGVGRENTEALSGYLTPVGKYSLGKRVAVYKPGVMGYYNNERAELIRTFGTRWIPFEEELEGCSEPAQGLGIHGVPWIESAGQLIEDPSSIGFYASDGCIRFKTEDIEEIYAISVTKPTVIEIVKSFEEAKLPGAYEATDV